MILGKERLMESFGENKWELDPTEEAIVLKNKVGTRRFIYKSEAVENRVRTKIGFDYLNQNAGWSEVMGVTIVSDGLSDHIFVRVMARGKRDWDPTVTYDDKDRRMNEWTLLVYSFEQSRGELLPEIGELPEHLDIEGTVNAFIAQVAEGVMIRPNLIPK